MNKTPPIREELIEVATDCLTTCAYAPPDRRHKKTITRIEYEILGAHPYRFTERELFKEIHVVQRKRHDLKIDSYNIKRSQLVKLFGWGIHRDQEGKLSIIAMESDKYKKLKETIMTTPSYRMNRA